MPTENDLIEKDLSREAPARLNQSQSRYVPHETLDSPRRDDIHTAETGYPPKPRQTGKEI